MVLFNPDLEFNRIHTFNKNISSKVNVIAQLEFELTYNDVTVQHINHNTTGALHPLQIICCDDIMFCFTNA